LIRTDFHHLASPASVTAFILLLLTPYIFPAFFPFDVNLILASAAAALFAASIMFQNRWIYLSKPLCAAFLVILFIQLFLLSSDQLLAVETWRLQTIQYLMVFIMLIIGASVASTSLIYWMKAYIAIAVSWGVVGLFVWLGGTSGDALQIGTVTLAMPPALKVAGPFNQGNIFAAAIGFAWLFSHWLYLQQKSPIYAVCIILFTALLFDTLSRSAWIAFLFTLALLLISLKPDRVLFTKKLIPFWLTGLAVGALLFEFSNPSGDHQDIALVTQTASASLTARIFIWVTAIAEFISAPLTGVGWGQFQPEFWVARPAAMAWISSNLHMDIPFSHVPYSAHNIFLHALAEAGLVAFIILCWGIYKLGHATIRLISKGDNIRLPFALAACAFVIQSQLNIVFHRPMMLMVAAFFAGIALAPWLWQNSWKVKLKPSVKLVSIVSAGLLLIWSSQLTLQWFKLEQAIINLNIEDKASVENLVGFIPHPRMGPLSLTWLGFTAAREQQHLPLLKWMVPYLKPSLNEVPSVLAHQVLFYSLSFSQEFEEACRIGKVISSQKFPGEKNNAAYEKACESRQAVKYIFGY